MVRSAVQVRQKVGRNRNGTGTLLLPARSGAKRREEVRVQTYETIFITRPTLTEEEEKATVETMALIVTSGGGTFTANDRMGRRRLAYPILKQSDGVYIRFLYDSEAAVPKELERRCRLSDDVLRAMTVRLETNWAVASKEKAIRDEETRIENERIERENAAEAERKAAEEAAAKALLPDVEEEVTAAPEEGAETEPAAEAKVEVDAAAGADADGEAEPKSKSEPVVAAEAAASPAEDATEEKPPTEG